MVDSYGRLTGCRHRQHFCIIVEREWNDGRPEEFSFGTLIEDLIFRLPNQYEVATFGKIGSELELNPDIVIDIDVGT